LSSACHLGYCLWPLAYLTLNSFAGALESSLGDYNAVLQLEPRNVDALYYRGTVYEKLGKLDDAITDFTAVLTLDPNHIKASYARGACRNLKGDFASAIGAVALAVAAVPAAAAAASGHS
jgi:tetratricopeptide (TPR) repeat protein